MKIDSNTLAVAIVLFAVVLALIVWIASNGIQASLSELKETVLKNSGALAKLGSGGNQSLNASLPKGVSLIAGKTGCSQGGKPKVFFFTDPYCPACAASEPKISAFIEKFGAVTDVSYKIVVTHSGALIRDPNYGEDRVMLAHYYFACAQEQNKLNAFKKLFYENLNIGQNDYIPFTKTELDSFAREAGINTSQLASCVSGAKSKINADTQSALEYGRGTYSTPTTVVDCRFLGHAAYAEDALCYAFPETKGC